MTAIAIAAGCVAMAIAMTIGFIRVAQDKAEIEIRMETAERRYIEAVDELALLNDTMTKMEEQREHERKTMAESIKRLRRIVDDGKDDCLRRHANDDAIRVLLDHRASAGALPNPPADTDTPNSLPGDCTSANMGGCDRVQHRATGSATAVQRGSGAD